MFYTCMHSQCVNVFSPRSLPFICCVHFPIGIFPSFVRISSFTLPFLRLYSCFSAHSSTTAYTTEHRNSFWMRLSVVFAFVASYLCAPIQLRSVRVWVGLLRWYLLFFSLSHYILTTENVYRLSRCWLLSDRALMVAFFVFTSHFLCVVS